MTPALVTLTGEIIYEAVSCDDAFNQLRQWFMANIDNINTMPAEKKLQVIDLDTERVIKKDKEGYFFA